MAEQDIETYREHFTPEDINRFLRFNHYIAVNHGFTERFLAEHHPGWTRQELMEVLKAAKVLAGYRCRKDVAALHFNDATSFKVERLRRSTAQTEGTK